MKLAGIGAVGEEKPAVFLANDSDVGVSDVVADFGAALFAGEALECIRPVVAECAEGHDIHPFLGQHRRSRGRRQGIPTACLGAAGRRR
jgi:hypothetical protein